MIHTPEIVLPLFKQNMICNYHHKISRVMNRLILCLFCTHHDWYVMTYSFHHSQRFLFKDQSHTICIYWISTYPKYLLQKLMLYIGKNPTLTIGLCPNLLKYPKYGIWNKYFPNRLSRPTLNPSVTELASPLVTIPFGSISVTLWMIRVWSERL